MSQTRGRCHNKKAGIRAAVILIGLLHKSRKAKEKEREREESEGWVMFIRCGAGRGWCQGRAVGLQCSVEPGLCRKLYSLLSQRQERGALSSSWFSKFASGWSELVPECILSECVSTVDCVSGPVEMTHSFRRESE